MCAMQETRRKIRSRLGRFILTATCIILVLSYAAQVGAADNITVGIKESPPFTIKDTDGTWRGISVDLWRQIAQDLNQEFELREFDLKGLLEAVTSNTVDVAMAALTISADRETRIDFSQPYYASGLGIATLENPSANWLKAIRPFFSAAFFKALGALALVLLFFGILLWLFERRRNPQQFGGGVLRGIGSSFWWSAVTMTTVGYGDKAPVTLGGRLIAMVGMFTAIIIVSSFTATIASSLTVHQLDTAAVKSPADLLHVRVGTLGASTGETWLQRQSVGFTRYQTIAEGLTALQDERVDAIVYDAPLLRYAIQRGKLAGMSVIPIVSHREFYGFAFPQGSPLREDVNRILLRKVEDPTWPQVIEEYLGDIQ